jgi:hypothetical protein
MVASTKKEKIDLSSFMEDLENAAYDLDGTDIDAELYEARWADLCRDFDQAPCTTETFQEATQSLDEEDWRRLALSIDILEDEDLQVTCEQLFKRQNPSELLDVLSIELAVGKPLLTIELLCLSETRLEEFARNLLYQITGRIEGESLRTSKQKLDALDYERLLGDAEKAKEAAEARLEELRKIQEEERASFERSKW